MTPFVQFCLNYPDAIHLANAYNHFWCGDIDDDLCSSCPNNRTPGNNCNTFTPSELSYLISNHPELLV